MIYFLAEDPDIVFNDRVATWDLSLTFTELVGPASCQRVTVTTTDGTVFTREQGDCPGASVPETVRFDGYLKDTDGRPVSGVQTGCMRGHAHTRAARPWVGRDSPTSLLTRVWSPLDSLACAWPARALQLLVSVICKWCPASGALQLPVSLPTCAPPPPCSPASSWRCCGLVF